MLNLKHPYLIESSVHLDNIRKGVFFNRLILPKAKSDSLLTIFKLEQGLEISDSELRNLNLHLSFIGLKQIERSFK